MQGRPDLPVGSYVLDEDKQAPEHDRRIPDDVRIAVLERDEFACRVCGWSLAQLRPEDPRKFLELHQVEHHHGAYGQEQGGNVAVGPDALLQSSTPGPTKRLPRALVRAEAWKRQLMEGRAPNLEAIAKAEDVTAAYAARLIRVAFLAPDLKRAIDEGRQPAGLNLQKVLTREVPLEWDERWALYVSLLMRWRSPRRRPFERLRLPDFGQGRAAFDLTRLTRQKLSGRRRRTHRAFFCQLRCSNAASALVSRQDWNRRRGDAGLTMVYGFQW